MKTTLLDAALALRREGYSIFPLKPRDKRPHGELLPQICTWPPDPKTSAQIEARPGVMVDRGHGTWEPYQHQYPTDAEIRRWWALCPTANIAIVTGEISGIIVADGDGLDGIAALATFGWRPEQCPTATTGKGLHGYYQWPGFEVHNFAGKLPGLDLRGDGGYVVAPPSIHPDGRMYSWSNDSHRTPEAPPWLLALISPPKTCSKAPSTVTLGTGSATSPRLRAWATTWTTSHVKRVEAAADGSKADTLFKSAIALGGLLAHGLITETEIEDQLLATVEGRAKHLGTARLNIRNGIRIGRTMPQDLPEEPKECRPDFDQAGFAICPEHRRRLRSKGDFYWCATSKQGTKNGWCEFKFSGTGYTPPIDTEGAATPAEIATAMAVDSDLSPVERKVMYYIAEHAGTHGWSQPSTLEIASSIGHDRRHVYRCIERLETLGYIQVNRIPGHPSIFVLQLPREGETLSQTEAGHPFQEESPDFWPRGDINVIPLKEEEVNLSALKGGVPVPQKNDPLPPTETSTPEPLFRLLPPLVAEPPAPAPVLIDVMRNLAVLLTWDIRQLLPAIQAAYPGRWTETRIREVYQAERAESDRQRRAPFLAGKQSTPVPVEMPSSQVPTHPPPEAPRVLAISVGDPVKVGIDLANAGHWQQAWAVWRGLPRGARRAALHLRLTELYAAQPDAGQGRAA